MSVTIQIRRGTESQIAGSTLAMGELALATDTKGVFTFDGVAKLLVGKTLCDVLDNRPVSGVSGRMFLDVVTNSLYVDTGSAWVGISSDPTELLDCGNVIDDPLTTINGGDIV